MADSFAKASGAGTFAKPDEKLVYITPKLLEYGTLKDLTLALDCGGQPLDGNVDLCDPHNGGIHSRTH